MAEHWHEFFTSAKPKQQERAGITLASTTETQKNLDSAMSRRKASEAEAGFTYTEVGPSIVEQDGSIEHGAVTLRGDYPKAKDNSEMLDDAFAGMTPQQRAMNRANYDVGTLAARAAIPDWQETIDQPELELAPHIGEMIVDGGIPNGPIVAYYLGKHRVEVERLNGMSRKQAQQRIVELSAKLVNNPEGVVLDTAPFRVYRKVRNEQVRNQYGNRR